MPVEKNYKETWTCAGQIFSSRKYMYFWLPRNKTWFWRYVTNFARLVVNISREMHENPKTQKSFNPFETWTYCYWRTVFPNTTGLEDFAEIAKQMYVARVKHHRYDVIQCKAWKDLETQKIFHFCYIFDRKVIESPFSGSPCGSFRKSLLIFLK